jgi:hypothetical protein
LKNAPELSSGDVYLENVSRRRNTLQPQINLSLTAMMRRMGETTPEQLKFHYFLTAPANRFCQVRIRHFLQAVDAEIVGGSEAFHRRRLGIVGRLAQRILGSNGR